MRFSWRLIVLLISLNVFISAVNSQQFLAPLPVEDAVAQLTLGSVSISTDGQRIAYVVRDYRRREALNDPKSTLITPTGVTKQADIWITNSRSGETKNLTGGKGNSWGQAWSPNGRWLAFYSDRDGHPRLWVWDESTDRLRRVSDEFVRTLYSHERVSWTPDSRRVLVKLLPENGDIREAAEPAENRSQAFASSVGQTGTQRIPASPTVTVFSSSVTSKQLNGAESLEVIEIANPFVQKRLGDLAMVDVSSGSVQRLVRRAETPWYSISPDGAAVGFSAVKGHEKNSQQASFDIAVVSLRDGQKRVVASNVKQIWGSFSWSPDGRSLSYLTASSDPLARTDCFVVSVTGGAPRNLTPGEHPRFGDNDTAVPLWDAAGKSLYLLGGDALWRASVGDERASQVAKIPNKRLIGIVALADGRIASTDSGRSVVITTRDDRTKQVGFYKMDLTKGKSSQLVEEDKSYSKVIGFKSDVAIDGQGASFISQDAGHCPDLWFAGMNFKNPRRLTHVNSQFDKYVLGQSRLIQWEGTNGEKLRGALLLPAGYQEGKRYPIVVWVYGGDYGSDAVNTFGIIPSSTFNMQVLATRGYAILYPDAPLRLGTPLKDLAATVLPGVDRAIELGIADPDRLGVMGHSYGGYSTLALIVQTTRFKAATIGGSAAGNIFTSYGNLTNGLPSFVGYIEREQGRMGGTPWQYRDRYIENSPYFYLDKVKTPLLLAHGTVDTIPLSWSDETFVALQRLGKEVQYLRYAGEGHVIQGYANQVDFWNRRIEWFDNWLDISRDQQGNLVWDGEKVKFRNGAPTK
ncbi:MAG TPA: prolyl oligopeptidase family serine peptidase [Pyrinomonadaceae bacterium]|nr:prolyl oligopeptidase family serine peptidase [Pyrinomonadaceae bacterium]